MNGSDDGRRAEMEESLAAEDLNPSDFALLNSIRSYPSATDFANIEVPVLCTYGARSPKSMVRLVKLLAAAIPTGTAQMIEGAGHAAPFDATDNFVRAIAGSVTPLVEAGAA